MTISNPINQVLIRLNIIKLRYFNKNIQKYQFFKLNMVKFKLVIEKNDINRKLSEKFPNSKITKIKAPL